MDTAVARGSRPLQILLLLTVTVPALAVSWGFVNGRLAFVLYREPKLIAIAVLGWTLVAAWLWRFRTELSIGDLQRTLTRKPMVVLAVFLGYLATTGLWVRVPENYWYELNQYLTLFVLLVVLLMWSDRDPSIAPRVRIGVVTALAVVTAVGLLQVVAPLPFLSPIDPQLGASHPSFMGYKNPAALAILGQIFLVAGLVFSGAVRRSLRIFLGALLLTELVYLFSLGSRTSTMALMIGVLFLVGLWWTRSRNPRRVVWGVVFVVALILVFGATLAADKDSRRRAASMAAFITHPATYFESDRGTYLLNTLDMVRHHPMGVGLGDWQTHYPVFRRHNPGLAFSTDHQVRRAHSDHVQFLGEIGWPGFALWVGFLITLVWTTSREYLTTGRRESLFVSAQVVAFAAAMTTDYVIELPYHKALFFLVVFLVIQTRRSRGRGPHTNRSRIFLGAAIATTILALGQIALHASLAHKIQLAAHLERSYASGLQIAAGSEVDPGVLPFARSYSFGSRFASTVGHTKTFYRDWLILGQCALVLERRDVALAAIEKSLDLHPYYPQAHLLMSRLEEEPDASLRWLETYEHLMQGPANGSARPPMKSNLKTPP